MEITTKLTEQRSTSFPNRKPLQFLPGDGSQNNFRIILGIPLDITAKL